MKQKINFLKNRALLNYEYLRKKTVLKGFPIEITIELTNWCNLDCVFCPHRKMKRPVGFIEVNLFKKIIDEIKGYVESVDLDLMGESAMHPQIFEIIRYCKKAGLKTSLNSNMTGIDSGRAKQLVDSGLDLLVMGIDGVTKETYEQIRRGASFDITKKNIEAILAMKTNSLYRVVQMVYVTASRKEVLSFLRVWRNKGAQYLRIQPYQNIDKEKVDLNALPVTRQRMGRVCIQPWKKIAICWDGSVVLCCNDYDTFHVIGDIKNEHTLDVWNGAPMQELRGLLVARQWERLPLCSRCFPFEPNNLLLWGSTLVNPIQLRKMLFIFEKLMIFHNVYFFRYF